MSSPLTVSLTGQALLDSPFFNKGLAFTKQERDIFHLNGLLPSSEHDLEIQVSNAYESIMRQEGNLNRHVALRALQDENETVFYALLDKYLIEMMPLVYTPGVGEACLNFSKIYQRPRGLYITTEHKGRISQILASPDYDNIRMVIVTDGERILGLGDLGANGMGIPIGKLSLYTACSGLNPSYMLPVTLDVGTENEALLNDPHYIGLKQRRLRGKAYDEFIDEFVKAVQKRWPNSLLHWEDFAGRNAAPLLQRYRDQILSFNDDIQGTASIANAAILAGIAKKKETLSQQRIVIIGGGSAGCGIAYQLLQACIAEGLSQKEALNLFYIFDRPGLLLQGMDDLTEAQQLFARPDALTDGGNTDLTKAINQIRPTILIGVSGQAGLFTKDMITSMAHYCENPLIFPLSNPTSHIEARPEDILAWTKGKAIIGTGSPFLPIEFDGKIIKIDQTNNAYIFPGLGLGALACQAQKISDNMLMAAAKAVVSCSASQENDGLLPPLSAIKDVAHKVARFVALQAKEEGLCPDFDETSLEENIAALSWEPVYRPYHFAPKA
ncbi:NAD-dependent malic enzyme [Aristophania vespae]|uniref:NAD-dependent malic enzyme n=1 Tax=Aristophania vespae TaxID=2697033 RepID=UPI00235137E1|nr:NAD-dependent malic enzyme [Aristophania vespae]UMM64455.1 NAD-dependent malic enzyme [Aristophania vespae]